MIIKNVFKVFVLSAWIGKKSLIVESNSKVIVL